MKIESINTNLSNKFRNFISYMSVGYEIKSSEIDTNFHFHFLFPIFILFKYNFKLF